MKKRTKIITILSVSLFAIGLIYWEFKEDLKEYFLLKHSIIWNKNVKLKYEDFQKEPNLESEFDINFYCGLYLKSSPIEKAYARAFFDKNKSWVKDTTKFNFKELLEMGKIEFDLTEVYARKFNFEISKIKENENVSYDDLEKIGDRIYSEYDEIKNQIYNDDTKNVTQLIEFWKPKVENLLKETEK